ncbi:MAG: Holliday junction resolvase RuvX [Deltaproteobacteria bacterium]|nr:Holliday junction resolvase RuvX [Deltaproteobacteria bacterium]
MKYIAVDYGLKRTGIAVSDAEGRMAFPRCTLIRSTRTRFFTELAACLAEEAPHAIVVGLPLSMDGSESLSTRQTRHFVERLKRRTDLPIFWMNEQLSSHEAEQDLHEAGARGARLRHVLDQQAACRILQSFLAQPEHTRSRA